MEAEQGDKVRIKELKHRGQRGVVESVQVDKLVIRLDSSSELMCLTANDVTNYSLAARKAWQQTPNRRVGRPKGSTTTDRVSVTLRIDRELWLRFQNAEATGQLDDRLTSINQWIDRGLNELTTKRKKER